MKKEKVSNLEKVSDYTALTVEHHFTDAELLKKSSELAGLTAEIEIQEAKKKAVGAEFKNKIDGLKAQAKLIAGNINNKWENQDRACELFLDFENKIRVYISKANGEELKSEPFHESDFDKRQLKMNLDAQIDENNQVGDFAEKPTPKDNLPEHYGKDHEQAPDALDEVIAGKVKKFKADKKSGAIKSKPPYPVATDETDIPDGMHLDANGNLTDL